MYVSRIQNLPLLPHYVFVHARQCNEVVIRDTIKERGRRKRVYGQLNFKETFFPGLMETVRLAFELAVVDAPIVMLAAILAPISEPIMGVLWWYM